MPEFHVVDPDIELRAETEASLIHLRVLDTNDHQDDYKSNLDLIHVRNRRKRYLDANPDYFSSALELADPLLYDRLIRRFQTASEREQEGRRKGYSGVLEADMFRAEAKIDALRNPDPSVILAYKRGPDGEILAEEAGEVPQNKEEGFARWKLEMELRFLRGDDSDFDYKSVDDNEAWNDLDEERREAEDKYFGEEQPCFVVELDKDITGETGIQDF